MTTEDHTTGSPADRPHGVPHTLRPGRVSILDWAAHSRSETSRWLGDTRHWWDGEQLVLVHTPGEDGPGEIRPRPGWVLVGWPDAVVTVSSARTAARLYQKETTDE